MRAEFPQMTGVAPLLFRMATPRISIPEIPGAYDPVLQVWVIEAGGTTRPIVQSERDDLVEITTKTRVRQEADDEEVMTDSVRARLVQPPWLLELSTKTEVQQESDDEITAEGGLQIEPSCRALAELDTKTGVQQESDDQREGVGLLELGTKTFVQQEQDDECTEAQLFDDPF